MDVKYRRLTSVYAAKTVSKSHLFIRFQPPNLLDLAVAIHRISASIFAGLGRYSDARVGFDVVAQTVGTWVGWDDFLSLHCEIDVELATVNSLTCDSEGELCGAHCCSSRT